MGGCGGRTLKECVSIGEEEEHCCTACEQGDPSCLGDVLHSLVFSILCDKSGDQGHGEDR